MMTSQKLLVFSLFIVLCTTAKAQLEVDRFSFSGYHAIGVGAFFNFAVPVTKIAYFTGDVDLNYYADNDVLTIPLLAGFRIMLNSKSTGFYLEPNAGYTLGTSDIYETDANGNFITNGNGYVHQKLSGASAGLAFGYIFQQANLGIRYEHIFASIGEDLISLRISHNFTFGKRKK